MRNSTHRIQLAPLAIMLLVTTHAAYGQTKPPANVQEIADDDIVRISTTMVTVPISVMDRQGRFIPDLIQAQFHLFENGVAQEIASFESAERPFTVALLLDTSDSTKFKLSDIQDAAIAFTQQLRPDDRVLVVAFDKSATILTEATSDRRILSSAIRRAKTGGGTGLYNALDIIVRERLNQIRGRKAMVLFTDGVDTSSSGATYDSTLRLAQELDALVYAIQYNTVDDAGSQAMATNQMITTSKGESLHTAYVRAERYLRLLTDRTGGRFFFADTLKHLTGVFAQVAQELRQQYTVSYYPKNQTADGAVRQIKVRVDQPNAAVRARRTYVFKTSKPPAR